jgi:UDP-glucose 4-epimerase
MQIKGIIDVFTQDKRSDIVYKPECKNAPQYIFDISKTVQDLNYVPIYDYYAYLRDMKKEMELNRFKELWGEE